MRQLYLRVEACGRDRWNHTAAVLAMLANVNRDPKRRRRPFMPANFHPYEQGRQRRGGLRITSANIGVLEKLFCE